MATEATVEQAQQPTLEQHTALEEKAARDAWKVAVGHPANAALLRRDPLKAYRDIANLFKHAVDTPAAHAIADRSLAGLDAFEAAHPKLVRDAERRRAFRRSWLARAAASHNAAISPRERPTITPVSVGRASPRPRSSPAHRRAARVAARSSDSSSRGDPSRDDEPPAAARGKELLELLCGDCGVTFTSPRRKKFCDECGSGAGRVRRNYRKHHPPVASRSTPGGLTVPKPEKRKLPLSVGQLGDPDPDLGFRDVDGTFVWWSEITPSVWHGRKNGVLGAVA